jgi:hypothetical protein
MRKIAVIAMFAIVAAMVPMTTAGTQPLPGTLDGVGTLMAINATGTGGVGVQVDLWIQIDNDQWVEFEMTSPDQEEIQVPIGARRFQVCGQGSTSADPCVGETVPLGSSPGNVTVESNDIINFLISPVYFPTYVYAEEMETDPTETDNAALTVVSSIPGVPIDVCLGPDDHETEHVIQNLVGPGAFQYQEFDGLDGETRRVFIYIGTFAVHGSVCGGGEGIAPPGGPAIQELGFPPGSNTVINLTPDTGCTSDCGYQIFPGEEPPSTNNNIDAFCAVVLEAANITPWLQELFAEVEVGNPETYPDPDKVEKVIVRIAELLEKGNETAPEGEVRDAWLLATAQFVETGRLAAVDYDLEALPQDDLRRLVSSIDTPAEDDHEVVAATDIIAAWVTANCFGTTAIEAEPSFTG